MIDTAYNYSIKNCPCMNREMGIYFKNFNKNNNDEWPE